MTNMTKQLGIKSKLVKLAAPIALACAFSVSAAPAATNSAPAKPQVSAQVQQAAQRVGQIQQEQELATIRNKTLKANPKLVKDIKAYETAFNNKAKALGYHPDQELKRLREIQTKARDQKTTDAQRKDLAKEFASIQKKLIKQRQTIMSDPAISKMEQQLEKNTITAMKKQDPKTDKLLKELDSLMAKFKRS
ncbi:hypothetical protein FA893_13975 [Photobacterium damselae subsp. piscicida]|uniref:hypothetical protein n=1 Tax=Photobacterium damselae TaxID=38293 RepID=UPI0002D38558|nr:hypothetical protein [Photobacterium damselae]TFZ53565.1 hypothetical protein E4T25_16045 [Photobacterium damselae subsp. piscicida]TJZ88325.1 hypothetical protein FA893_13975 [Photobacterium damselae subsp. piscicida]BBC41897.1 hypothetical protein PDPE_1-02738 [Photobacterium damselae subsp. piscicida]